jgi:hypothetical protein
MSLKTTRTNSLLKTGHSACMNPNDDENWNQQDFSKKIRLLFHFVSLFL